MSFKRTAYILCRAAALLAALLLFSAVMSCASDEGSAADSVEVFRLENGLSLFTVENHTVPLVYIEIAVRAGAITQTPENAGLFHLYEHMMFKGNDLYPSAASVQRALSDMGVADWNGTTGTDCVNYFFTIPSDQLEAGLAFWNAAIRNPLMDEKEFENEKKVVLSEIRGDEAKPARVFYDALHLDMFPDFPYKTDAGGSPDVVQNATIAQLREIQRSYYIPSNAALFVGGDIDTEMTRTLVRTIYGGWKNHGPSSGEGMAQPTMTPFDDVQFRVMPYDQISEQIAQVAVNFRGPDVDFNEDDTYTADYLLHLISDPQGIFKRTLTQDPLLQIPETDYVSASYGTTRASSILSFNAVMLNPYDNIADRTERFLSLIQDDLLRSVAKERKSFTKKSARALVRRISDSEKINSESAEDILSVTRFWWASAAPGYYEGYKKNLLKVSGKDAENFVDEYVRKRSPLVTVLVNPAVYEECRDELSSRGYKEINSQNAFWWKKERFAPDFSLMPSPDRTESPETEPSYRAREDGGRESQSGAGKDSPELKVSRLLNGIPVYVQETGSPMVSVALCVRGGVKNLTPGTSGLEGALFNIMSESSKKYSYAERNALSYKTLMKISYAARQSGSWLYLDVLEDYLDEALPVLVDGFLEPDYAQDVFDNMMTMYSQSIQTMLNNPSSLLSYEAMNEIYADHPFMTRTTVTPDSVSSVTIDNLMALHEKIVRPERIFVVVSGNVDSKKITAALDKTLGAFGEPCSGEGEDSYGGSFRLSDVPPVTVSGKNVVMSHPSCAGTGFAYRYFRSPANTDPDFVPAQLAANVYTQILFNVVREHYGVCYSPYSYVIGSAAPVGCEYLYRLSDFTDFASCVKEARNLMRDGVLIESADPSGSYTYTTLESELKGYKNSYINSAYSDGATSSGQVSSMAYNLLQFDDALHDKVQLEQVREASAQDILRVFRKYWIDESSRWFVITGPENLSLVESVLN